MATNGLTTQHAHPKTWDTDNLFTLNTFTMLVSTFEISWLRLCAYHKSKSVSVCELNVYDVCWCYFNGVHFIFHFQSTWLISVLVDCATNTGTHTLTTSLCGNTKWFKRCLLLYFGFWCECFERFYMVTLPASNGMSFSISACCRQ